MTELQKAIGRKVRVNSKDPRARNLLVFLDGDLMHYCLEADEEEGWVEVVDHDAWNKGAGSIAPFDNPYKVFVKRLYGEVEIREKEDSCPKE